MSCNGCIVRLVDALLFLFFLLVTLVCPLLDAQSVLPLHYFPKQAVALNDWYIKEYADYLVSEVPAFFYALVWSEILLLWPLAIANVFALVAGKPWFGTTCLIFGTSCSTAMVAIMGELLGSGKASDRTLTFYYPYTCLAVLAFLRGVIPLVAPAKISPALDLKKRA